MLLGWKINPQLIVTVLPATRLLDDFTKKFLLISHLQQYAFTLLCGNLAFANREDFCTQRCARLVCYFCDSRCEFTYLFRFLLYSFRCVQSFFSKSLNHVGYRIHTMQTHFSGSVVEKPWAFLIVSVPGFISPDMSQSDAPRAVDLAVPDLVIIVQMRLVVITSPAKLNPNGQPYVKLFQCFVQNGYSFC